jgi:hypothetical protein
VGGPQGVLTFVIDQHQKLCGVVLKWIGHDDSSVL